MNYNEITKQMNILKNKILIIDNELPILNRQEKYSEHMKKFAERENIKKQLI